MSESHDIRPKQIPNVYQESFSGDLGRQLLTRGLISFDQLKIARIEQKRRQVPLGRILVQMGLIEERVMTGVLADNHNLIPFDRTKTVIDTGLLEQFSRVEAEVYYALPLFVDGGVLHVAMVDIHDIKTRDMLKYRFNCHDVCPHPAGVADLGAAIQGVYDHDFSVEGLLRALEQASCPGDGHRDVMNQDHESVTDFLNTVFLYALKNRASDIHFEPEGFCVRIRMRIDGILRPFLTFHHDHWSFICVRLKMMSCLNIAEYRRSQSGRFGLFLGGREVDFRLSTHPTIHGENIVIRILDKAKTLLSLTQLGFRDDQVRLLETLVKHPQGLLLVTGPTGSGKTTTLYSLLQVLSSAQLNIMTLEDPVEYEVPLLRQCAIKDVGGMSFADGIRSILRQAPDVILVGEIRDEETANMALRATFTGHLVLATLHTSDVFGAFPRLMDLGIPSHLIAGNLIGIVAQRLVRLLCCACKIIQSDGTAQPSGCEQCGQTGFHGRTALAEILTIDDTLHDLIAQGASRSCLRSHALGRGFVSLGDDARQKWLNGLTTRQELTRCVAMDGI